MPSGLRCTLPEAKERRCGVNMKSGATTTKSHTASLPPPPPPARTAWDTLEYVLAAIGSGQTHVSVARALDLPRSRVTHLAQLSNLPQPVLELVRRRRLTPRHGELLARLSPADSILVAGKAIAGRWSVNRLRRELATSTHPAKPFQDDPNVLALQAELSAAIAAPVTIEATSADAGRLCISYFSLDELEGILERIKGQSKGW